MGFSKMIFTIPIILFLMVSETLAQLSFTPHTIAGGELDLDGAQSVYATDVDNDGDIDILSGSAINSQGGRRENKIVWLENDGNENFIFHTIDDDARGVSVAYALDLDSDGDTDVVSALDSKIVWYENDGNQNFTLNTISDSAIGAESVHASDIDSDGDTDVLFASYTQIGWFENYGNQNYTIHTISDNTIEAASVLASDMDNDGDIDMLSGGTKIIWYENDGAQNFTSHTIDDSLFCYSIFVQDINNDGHMDVLSSIFGSDPVPENKRKVVWYENDGSQHFKSRVIDNNVYSYSVYALDMDDDGDMDALSASADFIKWYENDGNENFIKHTITQVANGTSVYALDIDGDGDIDPLSASSTDGNISWYENDGNLNFSSNTIMHDTLALQLKMVEDLDKDGDKDIILTTQLDNDGDKDIILTTQDEANNIYKVVWLENEGNQNFSRHTLIDGIYSIPLVSTTDIDFDGDIDFVIGSESSITLYENDGTQKFTNHVISDRASGPVKVVDMDDDDDMDIISGSDDLVVWFENTGTTFIEHKNITSLPQKLELGQNYPNPFNPSTRIEFSLLQSGFISLKIYNILGDELTTLVSDRLAAGEYTYEWYAGNLASGVYLCRLTAGDNTRVRKMILMK